MNFTILIELLLLFAFTLPISWCFRLAYLT